MKNFLDQIKAIVAKEPQPDPKWAPKLIIYWTTKKDGRIYHDLSTGKRIAPADATKYTEWKNYDSKYLKYSANASPRFTYLKFHKKENIMELAYINIPTNRAKEKEAREWNWIRRRYFVDLNEYPRRIVDDKGRPSDRWEIHEILRDTPLKIKYQIDKEMFGGINTEDVWIWGYYDKLERFIKLKKNPNAKKTKTAKELLIEKGNALLKESPTEFPARIAGVSIVRNFEQISIIDTNGWRPCRFYFDGKTYAAAKEPNLGKVCGANLINQGFIYNPEDLAKGAFAKYANLFIKPDLQETSWGIDSREPEFPKDKTSHTWPLICMVTNPMLEKIAKSYGGIREIGHFSNKGEYPEFLGKNLDKKAKTPDKWLGVNKYQLTKLIQFMNSPQNLYSYWATRAIRVFRDAVEGNVAALDNHTSDAYINNLGAISELMDYHGRIPEPELENWIKAMLKKIIKSNKESHIGILRDTISMWYRLDYPRPALENIPVSELGRLHDTFVAMYNEQLRHWREQREEQNRKELEKRAKLNKVKIEFRKTLEFEDKEHLIRLPVDKNEIVKEGMELHHCVGGYAERHETGDTTIMFLRKKSEPDKPFYTIEVEIGVADDKVAGLRIKQAHCVNNGWLGLCVSAAQFVYKWCRIKNIEVRKEILLCQSHGYSPTNQFLPDSVLEV